MGRAWIVLIASMCVVHGARAQDVPASEPVLSDGGYTWARVRGERLGVIQDIAVSPDGAIYAADDGGGIYRRTPYSGWQLMLAPRFSVLGDTSVDEDVRMQVEVRLGEILAEKSLDVDTDADSYSSVEELQSAILQAAADVVSDAANEVQAELGWLQAEKEQDIESRVWLTDAGSVLAARSDGLWVSRDEGRSWRQAVTVPVFALTRVGELWVLGTEDGTRIAVRDGRWVDVDDGTEGVQLADLLRRAGGVLGATDRGLTWSPDGRSWEPRARVDGGVGRLAGEVGGDDLVWVVGARGLYRSLDQGATVERVTNFLAAGVDSVIRLGSQHALGSGNGTVVETIDGGLTWSAFQSGLGRIERGRLFRGADAVVYLADGGLLYRVREDRSRAAVEAAFIDVEALLGASLHRTGLQEAATIGSVRLSTLVPEFTVEAYWRPDNDLDFLFGRGTVFDRGADLRLLARVTWRPGRSTAVPDLVISEGQAFLIGGDNDGPAIARLDRVLHRYRASIADRVVGLFNDRRDVIAEAPALRPNDVFRRVMNDLERREIEAHLDALSGGALSRWYSSEAVAVQE